MTTKAMATPITIAKKTPKAKKLWIIGLLLRGTCRNFLPSFVPNPQERQVKLESIWFSSGKGPIQQYNENIFWQNLPLYLNSTTTN